MKFPFFLLVFFAVFSGCFAANPALAEDKKEPVLLTSEEQAWLTEYGPKVRVSLVNLPPLQFKQEGKFTGYQVDILEAVLMRVGLEPVYTLEPFAEVFADLKEKKTEISLDFIPTEERGQVVLFSEKKFDIYMGIFARKERTDLNSIEALKNARIASHPGYGLEPKLKRLLPDAEIVYAIDPQGMFRLVSSGEADAVVHGLTSGEFMLQKNLILNVVSHGEFLAKGESRLQAAEFVVRKDLPHLMSIIDKSFASLPEAEKQSIWNNWFGKNASKVKASSILFTDQERAWMAQKHPVRVGFWQHPPYFYLKNGKVVGLSVDLLNKVSEKTGVIFQFENKLGRFADILEGLKKHEGPDLVGAMMPTIDRKKSILFTKPYINSPRFIFTRDSASFVSSINNLFGRKVAVVKDYVVHTDLAQRFPEIDLLVTNNNEEALRSVSSGAAFAFIGDLISTPAMINQFGLKNLKAACPSGLPDHPLGMGVRNDWPEFWSIISKALDVIPEDEMATIINRWSTVKIDHGIKPGDVLKWGGITASIAICILLLFAFWNRSLAKQVQQRTADLFYQAKLLENVSDGVVSIDLEFRIISWNEACERIYGWKTEEVMGKVFAELTSTEYHNCTREDAFLQIKTQGSWHGEILQYRKDKEKMYVQASISQVKNNTGEVIGYVGVNRDITEQKKSDEKIRRSEEYFSKIFYSQAIPMAIINTETGERIDFNQSYVDLAGYTREELQQQTLFSLTVGVEPKDQRRAVETLRKERQVSGYPMTIKTKSGKTKHLVGSAAMLEHGDGNLAISAWTDITKRIVAEEELRVSEEKFFKVFQGTPNAVSISNLESGKFVEVNQSFERLFGFSHDELIEKRALDVNIWKNPCDRDRLMKDHRNDRQLHVEGLELVKKTGETIITDVNFVVIEISGIEHSIAIITDITDRRQAEEQVQQYQTRLKALASKLTIAEEAERSCIAAELHDHVGQILAFSHIQIGRAQRLAKEEKLQGILEEISGQLLESIGYTKELVFDLSSPLLHELGLTTAIADWLEEHVSRKNGITTELIGSYQELFLSKELRSILFRNVRELLTNVIKHAQASNVIVSLESNSSELNITVHDDGVGFQADAERPVAFTHPGFGLFSIRERLDDFGGSLTVVSSPGKGCKVRMTIPT